MKESAVLLRVSASVLSLVVTPLAMFVLGVYLAKWLGFDNIFIPLGLALLGLVAAVQEVVRSILKYNRVVDETNSETNSDDNDK